MTKPTRISATPPLRLVITLFHGAPEMLKTVLDSGILLASVAAAALDAFFNPDQTTAEAGAAPPAVADHA